MLKKEVIINDIIKGYISDISEIGMYIHAQVEFLPAAILDLSFTINEKQIKVKGVVQHVQPGVGIEIIFLNLLPSDLSDVKKFLHLQSTQLEKKSAVKKILLVDDNAQLRSAYRNKLIEDGFNVTEAQSGTEAFMRLQEMRFDLVALDLWMEGID
ncbi:MAG: response regulator, partial [Nitrospirota bacterium]|nr:response regulator [Nitrospirota bacterium]